MEVPSVCPQTPRYLLAREFSLPRDRFPSRWELGVLPASQMSVREYLEIDGGSVKYVGTSTISPSTLSRPLEP